MSLALSSPFGLSLGIWLECAILLRYRPCPWIETLKLYKDRQNATFAVCPQPAPTPRFRKLRWQHG
jgi:hypothetical protein